MLKKLQGKLTPHAPILNEDFDIDHAIDSYYADKFKLGSRARVADTLRDLRETFMRNPSLLKRKNLMIRLYGQLGEERVDGAVITARRAVQINPNIPDKDLPFILDEMTKKDAKLRQLQDEARAELQAQLDRALKRKDELHKFWGPKIGQHCYAAVRFPEELDGYTHKDRMQSKQFAFKIDHNYDTEGDNEPYILWPIFNDFREIQKGLGTLISGLYAGHAAFIDMISDEELAKIKFVKTYKRKLDLSE